MHQRICMQKDNEFHDEELFPDQPPHLVLQLPHLHSMVLGSYAAWQALPSALSLKYLEDLDLLVGFNFAVSRSAVKYEDHCKHISSLVSTQLCMSSGGLACCVRKHGRVAEPPQSHSLACKYCS
jgi:hypothetical protein